MLINPKYLASLLTFFTWFYAVFSTASGRASTRVGSYALAVPTNNILELWCSCCHALLKAAFSLESRSWSTVAELAAIQQLKQTTLWLTLVGLAGEMDSEMGICLHIFHLIVCLDQSKRQWQGFWRHSMHCCAEICRKKLECMKDKIQRGKVLWNLPEIGIKYS